MCARKCIDATKHPNLKTTFDSVTPRQATGSQFLPRTGWFQSIGIFQHKKKKTHPWAISPTVSTLFRRRLRTSSAAACTATVSSSRWPSCRFAPLAQGSDATSSKRTLRTQQRASLLVTRSYERGAPGLTTSSNKDATSSKNATSDNAHCYL